MIHSQRSIPCVESKARSHTAWSIIESTTPWETKQDSAKDGVVNGLTCYLRPNGSAAFSLVAAASRNLGPTYFDLPLPHTPAWAEMACKIETTCCRYAFESRSTDVSSVEGMKTSPFINTNVMTRQNDKIFLFVHTKKIRITRYMPKFQFICLSNKTLCSLFVISAGPKGTERKNV